MIDQFGLFYDYNQYFINNFYFHFDVSYVFIHTADIYLDRKIIILYL